MFKKILKNKISILLGIAIAAIINTPTASAGVMHTYFNWCSLAVFPYNPSALTDTIDNVNTPQDEVAPYIKNIDNQCQNHLFYPKLNNQPKKYDNPPIPDKNSPENTVQAGAENIRAPITKHIHIYYNDSINNDGFYYQSVVDRFTITLESDAWDNINKNNISCDTPYPDTPPPGTPSKNSVIAALGNCNGSIPGLWGGTSVSKSDDSANKRLTITWKFGIDGNGGRPALWGNNGANFIVYNPNGSIKTVLDTTKADNRALPFHVNLPTTDKGEIWSATTTSQALLVETAIPMNNYATQHHNPDCNNGGWCLLPPPAGFLPENVEVKPGVTIQGKFYRLNIASVGTIWKKPPPPTAQLACSNLVIKQNGVDISSQSLPYNSTFNNLSVTATTLPPNTVLNTTWTAKAGGVNTGIFTPPAAGQNPTQGKTTNDTVNYSGPSTSAITTVTAEAYDPANPANLLCAKSFTVTPQQAQNQICSALNLTPNSPVVSAGSQTLFKANPQNNIVPHPAQIQWSENGNGSLSLGTGSIFLNQQFGNGFCPIPADNTTFTAPAACDYYYTAGSSGNGYVMISASPNLGNVPACTQTVSFSAQPPPGPVISCNTFTLTPSQLNTGSPTLLTANVTFTDGQNHTSTVHWTGNGTFTPINPAIIDANNNQPSNNNSFTTMFTPNSTNAEVLVQLTNISEANIVNSAQCINGGKSVAAPPLITIPPTIVLTQPPTLEKFVRRANHPNDPFTKNPLNIPQIPSSAYTTTQVEYKIIFIPDPSTPNLTATITDAISYELQGLTKLQTAGGNIIYVPNSMEVSIPKCPYSGSQGCWDGDIGKTTGVTLHNINSPIEITYKGLITDSVINNITCQDTNVCQEQYQNHARAKNMSYKTTINQPSKPLTYNITSNDILIQIFCRYILTRAAGDIYLESDLKTGIDINKCAEFKNVTGVTITPEAPQKPGITSSGKTELITINHDICTKGQSGLLDGELSNYYGQGISKNLSSQICEVRLRPGTHWKRTTIVDDIEENKTRIARWGFDFYGPTSINLLNMNNREKKVYHINGDLRVDQPFTLTDGQGAKTFIIEGHDLIIKRNITYAGCNNTAGCNARDMASLAFIVLNGSVYIDPEVKTISGIFFVQKGKRPESGQLISGSQSSPGQLSENPLTIYGSVFGDPQNLIEQRYYSGDFASEQAGVTIRFDSRVLINTPPGIQDVLRESSALSGG